MSMSQEEIEALMSGLDIAEEPKVEETKPLQRSNIDELLNDIALEPDKASGKPIFKPSNFTGIKSAKTKTYTDSVESSVTKKDKQNLELVKKASAIYSGLKNGNYLIGNSTCKGSISLGTACGKCSRCLEEAARIVDKYNKQTDSQANNKSKRPTASDTGFMKFDDGKCMVSLVDPDFIMGVGNILTFGAKKYAKNNWQLNTDIDRYKDSTMRHMMAYLGGELIDPESGQPHLDHIATNIMFLRYFEHGKGQKEIPNAC